MSIRSISLFVALLCILSCSEKKKEDPAPVDKLVGTWSVKEEVEFNRFTGMSFVTTQVPTITYKATITRATPTSIKLVTDRTGSVDYDYKGDLTVDWDAQTISVEGTIITGTITNENKFVVSYISGLSTGYYSIERTYTR